MQTKCFHCGLEVAPQFEYHTQVLGKQQIFCCPGCSAVAEAIVNNGLEDYYHYRSEFADKATDSEDNILDKLSVFDDESILHEFVDEQNGSSEIQLTISGIHCAACAWLIEKQLAKVTGINKVGVNVSARRATVSWDNQQLKFSQILGHIEKIGYHAKPFQAEQHEATFRQENKRFLKRLGLAGLMTMQVMMLNIGVFFDLFGHIDGQTKQYFNWISLFLTTPVILYSASEFYSSAWRAISVKMVNMDVPITLALSLTYVSGVFATIQNHGQTYFESLCMFVFFILTSRYLEHSARYKAAQLSANMLEYIPTTANLIDNNNVVAVLAKSLKVNQSVLVKSGEMVPVDGEIIEGQGQLDEAMLTGEFDLVSKSIGETVFAGTVNQLGTLTIKVNKTLKHSMLSQINLLQNKALLNKPQIATLADQFSQYFVILVLAISLVSYIVWLQIDESQALWITVSILIATCPCALGLATPSALSFAIAHLNSKGVLLKHGDALETISKVDWLALDKTGTLTEGRFTLAKCICNEKQNKDQCLQIAASLEQFSSHPIAKAFSKLPRSHSVTDFSTKIGQGVTGKIEGQIYKLGSSRFISLDVPKQMQNCNVFLATEDSVLCGFLLTDKIRPSATELLNEISNKQLILLSGDTPAVVEKVAEKLLIPIWLAQQTPEDKLNIIKQAQRDKHVAMMVGDGINDGPVLAQADISVTMGAGSDLAKSSADVILLDDSLEKISLLFAIATRCKVKIMQNMSWALGYNLLVLPLAVCGLLSPWMAVVGMSLSSLIVVVNSIRLLK